MSNLRVGDQIQYKNENGTGDKYTGIVLKLQDYRGHYTIDWGEHGVQTQKAEVLHLLKRKRTENFIAFLKENKGESNKQSTTNQRHGSKW